MSQKTILTFHGIGDPPRPVQESERSVWISKPQFEAVLDAISDREDVILTFDDGNASDAEIALPALARQGRTAIFFLVAGRLDEPGFVTTEDATKLVEAGMTVGSHGLHHTAWTALDQPDLVSDLNEARAVLEAATGRPVTEASCPFGQYDRRVLAALRQLDYEHVYTSDGGTTRERSWLRHRTTVDSDLLVVDRAVRHRSSMGELVARDLKSAIKQRRLLQAKARPRRTQGRQHVVIGFAEALSAPEVAWSLLEAGFQVTAFSRRGSRPSLRLCHDVRIEEVADPRRDARAAVADISRLAGSTGPAAVMPLDDTAVWACIEAELPGGTVLIGPSRSQAELALDKRAQLDAAERAGFIVPPTRICRAADEVLEVHEPLEFPMMIKPALAVASTGRGVHTARRHACANPHELGEAMQGLGDDVPLLVQPYIPGVGEGIFGLARDGHVLRWSAHRRVRMMSPHGSGSSACKSIPLDAELKDAASAMMRRAGWDGLFMIELLRDPAGSAWFVELNGRPWGSMALARRSGHEYPAWAVQARLDQAFEPPPPPPYAPVLCRHLGRELVHLLIVMRGRPSGALILWPPRLRTLRDVLTFHRDDRWYNLRPGALSLFLDDTVRTVSSAVRGALPT